MESALGGWNIFVEHRPLVPKQSERETKFACTHLLWGISHWLGSGLEAELLDLPTSNLPATWHSISKGVTILWYHLLLEKIMGSCWLKVPINLPISSLLSGKIVLGKGPGPGCPKQLKRGLTHCHSMSDVSVHPLSQVRVYLWSAKIIENV